MIKEKIRIGVVSDVVCPWCYIGKRRLENAMDEASDRFDFEVEYFPFELNPHMPEEGADYREYLIGKFGSESKFRQLTSHVKAIGAKEGLDFNMDLQKISPNTRNSHRLILVAKQEDKQIAVAEALFKAYFTQGIDLSKTDNLIEIAVEVGLNRTKIGQLLKSSTGILEIEMAEKEVYELGITAVPLYIIDNKFTISGAQSTEAFLKAFEEVSMEKVSGE